MASSSSGELAEAERAALDDGLRDAADQQHAAERDDERLQLEAGDEQPLDEADQQRDGERDGDAEPQRIARCRRSPCDEILAMMTPVRPTTEPTDRSMPPVMITKPMPMA